MKISDEIPVLPSGNFDDIKENGYYRVSGEYLNSPVSGELDGAIRFSAPTGDPWKVQEVYYNRRIYRRERNSDGEFNPWYMKKKVL